MGNVIAYMSMSLDGFVAGPNDQVDHLHAWSMAGETEFKMPGAENEVMRVAPATAGLLREPWPRFGAVIRLRTVAAHSCEAQDLGERSHHYAANSHLLLQAVHRPLLCSILSVRLRRVTQLQRRARTLGQPSSAAIDAPM